MRNISEELVFVQDLNSLPLALMVNNQGAELPSKLVYKSIITKHEKPII
jgi:hypothetical protein